MQALGESILLQAAAKADEQNIVADIFVRKGNVREHVIKLCYELNPDYVVMGQPKTEEDTDLFTSEQINDFSQRIETETGAKVILVKTGLRA